VFWKKVHRLPKHLKYHHPHAAIVTLDASDNLNLCATFSIKMPLVLKSTNQIKMGILMKGNENKKKNYKPTFYNHHEYFLSGNKISYKDLILIINGTYNEDGKDNEIPNLRIKILDDASLFYKWQLLRRNPNYKRTVDRHKHYYGNDRYAELSSAEAREHWKISEFSDYTSEKPHEEFYFILEEKLNFYTIGEYSFKDFCEDEEKFHECKEDDYPFDDGLYLSNKSKIIDSSIAGIIKEQLMFNSSTAPVKKNDDKRFCFLVLDLKNSCSIDDLSGLTKHLQERIKAYGSVESNQQVAPKNLKPTTSIVNFDRGILVYDFVRKNKITDELNKEINKEINKRKDGLNKKIKKATDGLNKEIKKITGQELSQSTLTRTYDSFSSYVEKAVQIFVQINKP
jgi:hypothetical protein